MATPDHQGPAELGGLNPDELFARGMQSIKMTGIGTGQIWEPPSVEEAAQLFPNYEVIDLIGRGGMGAVYKARQVALDRVVAIKLLPLEVSVDRDFAERFKREAKTMARMNHPNIVSVYDFGTTTEGHLFFVMEYVEGTTLHHIIKTTGLKPAQALEIIVGVCEALHYAHCEAVVHRDIKPANVLVDVRGRVKVTDFGLARMNVSAAEQAGYTMTGTVLGTPDYMAPEQKRGDHVDHRADIYSLGVMLYEMLCGQVPAGIFDPPSAKVGVDERVDQVVIRAMQQEPNRRYQNTAEMQHEVQTIHMSVNPKAKAPQPRAIPGAAQKKKNPLPLIASIAAAVAVGIGIALALRKDETAPSEKLSANTTLKPTEPIKVIELPKPTPIPEPPKPPTPEPPKIAAEAPKPSVIPVVPVATAGSTPAALPPVSGIQTPHPVINPSMAQAVAEVAPTPQTPVPPVATPVNPNNPPPPVIEAWRREADLGEVLMKRRDPDGAAEAFQRAIEYAEQSATPVPAADLGRLYYKLGSMEASLGEIAVARGTLEEGKRILLNARGSAKGTELNQLLSEIEATLRRLPRE